MKKKARKRIGYVDYSLDNYHANTYLELIRTSLADRGFEVAGCHAIKTDTGKAWADSMNVPYYDDPEELNNDVDFFAILAPSNPEIHLDLCKKVFKFGKPAFVDKTFAPDLRTARAIFRLADKHGVAVETCSALRYTDVQTHVQSLGGPDAVRHMVAFGAGGSFEEYAIHPVEMVISCMGTDAVRLMRRDRGGMIQLLMEFKEGRNATICMHCKTNTPFAAAVTSTDRTEMLTVDNSRLFRDAASAFLDLFESGKPGVDRTESLLIRRILDVAGKPEARKGFVRI